MKRPAPRRALPAAALGITNVQLARLVHESDPQKRLALALEVQGQIAAVVRRTDRLRAIIQAVIDAGVEVVAVDGAPLTADSLREVAEEGARP